MFTNARKMYARSFAKTAQDTQVIVLTVARDGIEPPTQGFSGRPKKKPR